MTDENMLPCSVTASAGIFSSTASIEQLVDPAGAVEQRELGVQVKVDEVSHRERYAEYCRSLTPNIVSQRFRALRLPIALYSHSIVDGGFELMS